MNISARSQIRTLSFAVAGAALALLLPSRAEASLIDLGAQAGIEKRSLSDRSYNTGFTWQLNADVTFFPLLMVGPYISFANLTPQIEGADSPSSINFRTIGVRVKLKLPVPGEFKPFAVAGVGWAHGDFPDQVFQRCEPQIGCISKALPNATANFAEFLLGGGVLWEVAGPLTFSLELNWRPSTGYKNDVYEQQVQSQSTTAPEPSRNGAAWVGMLGVGLSF
jgi:opacity protein-like surface antigen